MTRLTWDQFFLGVAAAAAARADCSRRQVGAVIVSPDHRVVGFGYNGSPPGEPGCLSDGACPRAKEGVPHGRGDYDNCISVHAEANAIMFSNWQERQGSTIYVTHEPCAGCSKLIRGSGIARVVTPEGQWV